MSTLGDWDHLYLTRPVWDPAQHREGCVASSPAAYQHPIRELRWQETLNRGREGTNSKAKRKQNEKTTCLMRVFFFSLYVYSKFMFFFTSFLWSLHLSRVCAHSLLFLFIWCVSFFFFLKNFGFAIGGQCWSPEAGLPLAGLGQGGRPTATERTSMFKAFEKKLPQFPG